MLPEPVSENNFLSEHIEILRFSYGHWTGRELVAQELNSKAAAARIYSAPFAVLSHGLGPDPFFTYANRTAQQLFAMSWQQLLQCPSRLSAETVVQAERNKLLAEVTTKGFIDHYSGVRVARTGQRFRIQNAIVWNIVNVQQKYLGQAVYFEHWDYL